MTIIDFALDGTPGDAALIVDGVRLPAADYADAQRVFRKLVCMRNEIQSLRKWQAEMLGHIAEAPRPPKREV